MTFWTNFLTKQISLLREDPLWQNIKIKILDVDATSSDIIVIKDYLEENNLGCKNKKMNIDGKDACCIHASFRCFSEEDQGRIKSKLEEKRTENQKSDAVETEEISIINRRKRKDPVSELMDGLTAVYATKEDKRKR